jgi:FtsH-binding integral membrane protein
MYKVYAWMTGGLLLTALTSYVVYSNPVLFITLVSSKFLFYLLLGAQLGLVWYLSSRIMQLRYSTGIMLFVAYAVLLGISLSVLFMVYDIQSMFFVLSITAGMFAIMALYGFFTKGDLTSLGSLFLMALIGLIIASITNWFLQSPLFELLISYGGVIIFTGLVAYDVQKIKLLAAHYGTDDESSNKVALIGALSLYLDFVNLFLSLLRILGRKKD